MSGARAPRSLAWLGLLPFALFAALFLITLTGVALFAIMVAVSRLALSSWHESEIGAET